MYKKLSASGARPPDPPPGALPLDPTGGSAPSPPFRLALRALSMVRPPLWQIGSATDAQYGLQTVPQYSLRSTVHVGLSVYLWWFNKYYSMVAVVVPVCRCIYSGITYHNCTSAAMRVYWHSWDNFVNTHLSNTHLSHSTFNIHLMHLHPGL